MSNVRYDVEIILDYDCGTIMSKPILLSSHKMYRGLPLYELTKLLKSYEKYEDVKVYINIRGAN